MSLGPCITLNTTKALFTLRTYGPCISFRASIAWLTLGPHLSGRATRTYRPRWTCDGITLISFWAWIAFSPLWSCHPLGPCNTIQPLWTCWTYRAGFTVWALIAPVTSRPLRTGSPDCPLRSC